MNDAFYSPDSSDEGLQSTADSVRDGRPYEVRYTETINPFGDGDIWVAVVCDQFGHVYSAFDRSKDRAVSVAVIGLFLHQDVLRLVW